MNKLHTGNRIKLLAALVLASCTFLVLIASPARAQVSDPTGDEAQELADLYAPIFMLKEQSEACDTEGEAFAPMSVDVILDNSDVTLRQAGEADPVVVRGPGASDLLDRGLGFYLDFNGLTLEADCIYEFDYNRYTQGRPSEVYAHIVQQPGETNLIALQYWSYWYYNDWNNKHESDWEFIQILFEASSIAEALDTQPVSVGYAQHEGGENAAWGSDKLQLSDGHPVVYSSSGSHASYFSSTYYLGRKGTEGFGCDTTEGPSREVRPEVLLLPDSVDDPSNPLAWINFEGRWGERHSGPFNGPTGPNNKEQWLAPVEWSDGLRSNSVSLPVAELGNGSTITRFCRFVDFSSNQYRAAKVSPYRIVALLGAALLFIRLMIALTDWGWVPAIPLVRRRRVGQLLRTAGAASTKSRGVILSISLLYIPFAILIAIVGWSVSLRTAQLLGGVIGPILYLVATMGTSLFWSETTVATRPSISAIRRKLIKSLQPTIWTIFLGAGIVGLLALTIVGTPLAIRQAIRYQFITPVTTIEGLSGKAALKRSADLVAGRWWYTAFVILLFNSLLVYINMVISLSLLVVFAGMPLWVFLGVSFAAWGLFVPTAATAPALLYGDAVAEENGEEQDAVVKPVSTLARRLIHPGQHNFQ